MKMKWGKGEHIFYRRRNERNKREWLARNLETERDQEII
jgi:hypothetical protein